MNRHPPFKILLFQIQQFHKNACIPTCAHHSFEQDKHYHLSRELALLANQVLKCSTATHKTLPSTLLHACAINLFRPGIANKHLSIAANWAQRTMVIFFQHKIIIFCISACFKNTFFKERVPFSCTKPHASGVL